MVKLKGFFKKIRRQFNSDNRGVSLVEILATVAIIAIISTPLINSFINAIKVNGQARIIQNGTSVAQDMAEVFKVFEVEQLVKNYEDQGVEVIYDETTGKYTFSNIAVEGADGEDFLVTVELDPTTYAGGLESDKLQVNDVNLPVFSGLYGSDCVMLYRQYASFDEQLMEIFAGTTLDDNIVKNINTDAERRKITKSTDIIVNCDYNSNSEKYFYDIRLNMTYTYDYGVSVTVTKSMEKSYSGDEIHNIYMICPIFDKYSIGFGGTEEFFYNSDKINITYNYTGNIDNEHDLYFYIAEQQATNIGYDAGKLMRINPRNLYINGVDYTMYNTESERLKVYTNIGDKDTTFSNSYDLTYGDYNTGIALYEMNVTVTEEGSTDTVATFTTTK